MQSADLNLLAVLDALLQEGSVTGAARRLHLTAPAVSRSLARLRSLIGDPLLVRAGRNLVPTPVALRLRTPAHDALAAAYDVLASARHPTDADIESGLERLFTVRTGPDNASGFGPAVLAAVRRRAPGARLAFTEDGDDPVTALRDGHVDLVVGGPPIGTGNDTVHRELLFTDAVVAVARRDGALAGGCRDGAPTLADLASQPHVNRAPRSAWHDQFDRRLAGADLARTVLATAPGFDAAFALVRDGDLVCLAPRRLTRRMLGDDLAMWPLPVELPGLIIEQAWHRRSHSDPEHRWLRARVRDAAIATGDALQ